MTKSNLIDLSIQHYGNPEAIPALIADNPQLFAGDREFDLMADVDTHLIVSLTIRDEDELKDKKALKELDGKTITS